MAPGASLTRERVVAAALQIVDRDGLDGLTMRALGRALGVDPMAVYHHLPNKAAVLDGVVEAVMREVPIGVAPELGWEHGFATLARSYRGALCAHPNALAVVATRPDVTPAALAVLDAALGVLLRAGFDPGYALKAVHATSCFVIGHAIDQSGLAELVGAEAAAAQQELLAGGAFPHLAQAAAAAADVSPDDTFEEGLAALIAGFRTAAPEVLINHS